MLMKHNIVSPYILTLGTEDYRKFLSTKFNVNMLKNIEPSYLEPVIFDGWRGKDMFNWFRLTNDEDIVLEVYPDSYTIINNKHKIVQKLPIPLDINDFINDMIRYNVQLIWTNWIDENFEPKDYLNVNHIPQYYVDLLKKMGKSHELNI
jgi:hypothetical protein